MVKPLQRFSRGARQGGRGHILAPLLLKIIVSTKTLPIGGLVYGPRTTHLDYLYFQIDQIKASEGTATTIIATTTSITSKIIKNLLLLLGRSRQC